MKRQTPEDDAQEAVVCWLRTNGYIPMASLNGVKLPGNAATRARRWQRFHKLGALVGAPDLTIMEPAPRDGRHVAIEMKSKTGRVSDAQREVHAKMRATGWIVLVAKGADDAIEKLMALGYGVRQ